ncbi:MAG: BON domain-containing protein [Planctomycetota bacterium]
MRLRILEFAVICSMACSSLAFADDAQIAKQLSTELRTAKSDGDLNGFHLGVKVEDGTVWIKGQVATEDQRTLALDRARRIDGVRLVVNDIKVNGNQVDGTAAAAVASNVDPAVSPAVAMRPAPVARQVMQSVMPAPIQQPIPTPSPVPVPVQAGRYAQQMSPVQAPQRPPMRTAMAQQPQYAGQRVAMAQGRPVQYAQDMGCQDCMAGGGIVDGGVIGTPVASYEGSVDGGIGYEQPQMPGHAWPSYAAYPNYAGVTYPKQYSPMAWPDIGPFYPYPQVPMGWRKVSLEWDDGWWMLDFKSK